MKDFLITTLPWCIAVTCICFSVVVYLMYMREQEHSRKLYQHWEQSVRVGRLACHHIKLLEAELKRTLEADDSESWKNL
jgi:hypothetical protein